MQTIMLEIRDESAALNPAELADFLYLFQGANVALSRIVPEKDRELMRSPSEDERQSFRSRLARFSPDDLDTFFDPAAGQEILQIKRISRQSPIEIVFCGCAFLLTLAVMFSGGEIVINEKGSFKAKLPPFGVGLKSLREALGLTRKVQAGFGIRWISIKLNAEEKATLLKKLNGTGGFQSLLSRLQPRLNRTTGDLELSQQDLQRIYRYKAKPQTGGFQARFEKIFGRHFRDELEC
ncbi:MAG: hypothetical protein HZA90_15010 [Verrucomicrobia bacterium]|nr:hypothetical protein [Verrucomicrobiota bacterium]